jgi:hypothetical protein
MACQVRECGGLVIGQSGTCPRKRSKLRTHAHHTLAEEDVEEEERWTENCPCLTSSPFCPCPTTCQSDKPRKPPPPSSSLLSLPFFSSILALALAQASAFCYTPNFYLLSFRGLASRPCFLCFPHCVVWYISLYPASGTSVHVPFCPTTCQGAAACEL